ncbi:hypothetical protein M0R72_12030 [Candidatus Pacearchaeota archaeon]|nr:hypothetical protein [Candidatus Pacearchaeota archaeon]
MTSLGVRYIQIPVTEEEFNQIDSLKEREQSWRDFALPRLLGTVGTCPK